MDYITRLTCGIIILAVPTIQYGGYFLLQLLTKKIDLPLTEFQRSMFRAGHAHAGVLVILALIAEVLLQYAKLPLPLIWLARIGFPLSAILISGGFFGAAAGQQITKPTSLISILYVGIFVLFLSLVVLGIGLIRK